MKNDLLLAMGTRISHRRRLINMTQEQLAEKMNVSVQMISNMENGNKAVRPENLLKGCEILDISADYILTGEENEFEASRLLTKINSLSQPERGLIEMIVDYLLDYEIPQRK